MLYRANVFQDAVITSVLPLHIFHPLLRTLGTLVRFPKEPPFPLVQPPQELLSHAGAQILGGAGLARVEGDLGGAGDEGLAEDGAYLPLLEEVQHPGPQAVAVVGLVPEGDGAGVGFQGRHDLVGQGRGQVQGNEGLRVVLGAAG